METSSGVNSEQRALRVPTQCSKRLSLIRILATTCSQEGWPHLRGALEQRTTPYSKECLSHTKSHKDTKSNTPIASGSRNTPPTDLASIRRRLYDHKNPEFLASVQSFSLLLAAIQSPLEPRFVVSWRIPKSRQTKMDKGIANACTPSRML